LRKKKVAATMTARRQTIAVFPILFLLLAGFHPIPGTAAESLVIPAWWKRPMTPCDNMLFQPRGTELSSPLSQFVFPYGTCLKENIANPLFFRKNKAGGMARFRGGEPPAAGTG
jgi:hypothetical protein